MNPHDFLASRGMLKRHAAVATGINEATMSRVMAGNRYPSFEIMCAFFQLSDGEVSLPDWIKMFEEKARAGDALPPSRAPNPLIEARGKRKGVKKWHGKPKQTTRRKPATTRSKTRSQRK